MSRNYTQTAGATMRASIMDCARVANIRCNHAQRSCNYLEVAAEHLRCHRCAGIPKLGPDFEDHLVAMKDRKVGVLCYLQALYGYGRLANTGYLSLLLVDQGGTYLNQAMSVA